MIIAVDFDGTVVTHEYPLIGRDIGAWPVLAELVNNGHDIILFTMRSGTLLKEATELFLANGIPLYGINVNPTQLTWTTSPKVHADLYIDDAALGIPLISVLPGERPFVHWLEVQKLLRKRGVLK